MGENVKCGPSYAPTSHPLFDGLATEFCDVVTGAPLVMSNGGPLLMKVQAVAGIKSMAGLVGCSGK